MVTDNRDKIREELISLVDQYGSRKLLAHRAGTTIQYLCLLSKRKCHPGLDTLISILKECGYELQIVKAPPTLIQRLQEKSLNAQTQEKQNGE